MRAILADTLTILLFVIVYKYLQVASWFSRAVRSFIRDIVNYDFSAVVLGTTAEAERPRIMKPSDRCRVKAGHWTS